LGAESENHIDFYSFFVVRPRLGGSILGIF